MVLTAPRRLVQHKGLLFPNSLSAPYPASHPTVRGREARSARDQPWAEPQCLWGRGARALETGSMLHLGAGRMLAGLGLLPACRLSYSLASGQWPWGGGIPLLGKLPWLLPQSL